MDAYIHVGFPTGASPDELRGLHWAELDDLDSDEPGIDITRTRRHSGKDCEDNGLVFCTSLGRPLDSDNVLRAFRAICKKGSLRSWVVPDGGVDPFVAGRSPSSKPVSSVTCWADFGGEGRMPRRGS